MTPPNTLSVHAQVRLLSLIAQRRTAEAALLTLPGLLAWLHSRQIGQVSPLLAWAAALALAAWALARLRRRFRAEAWQHGGTTLTQRWRTRMTAAGLLFGLGWSLPVFLVESSPPLEWSTAFYIALCGATTGAAVYMPAVLPSFVAFMTGIWVPAALAVPRMFPGNWTIVLAFCILFCLVSLRHARGTHRFLVQQIELEESSQRLSEQFRLARDRAEAAVQEKNLFLATASHDLRQPVHAMALLVEAIARRNQDPALRVLLQDLRQGLGSLSLMFNALLHLSRLEAGHAPRQRERVVLQPLLQETATLFREQAAQRGLRLRLRHAHSCSATVHADPSLLRQALVNLVHNALRYTTQGGILIGLRSRGDDWQIEICDTGTGIADDESTQIFAPYYRNAQARHIDSAGHGLGLAVVARCAALMHAELGFRSRLGRGSRFWLRLPKHVHGALAPVPGSTYQAAERPPLPQLSGRCLVVDDDPQVRSAWTALLTSWGIDVRCAADADDAMQWLDAGFRPQAIFCDQRLRSGQSGFDLLRALLARCPDASGAMVSGELGSPALRQAEEDGYTVMPKPLDPTPLHAVLARWLGGS